MSNFIRTAERKTKRELLEQLTDDDLINEIKKRKLGNQHDHKDYELIFMPPELFKTLMEKRATQVAKEILKEAQTDKELKETIEKSVTMSENKGIISNCSLCKKAFYEVDQTTAIKVKGNSGRIEHVYHRDCFLKKGTETEKQPTNTFNGEIKENDSDK